MPDLFCLEKEYTLGGNTTIYEYFTGLWEYEVHNNPKVSSLRAFDPKLYD